MVRKPEKQEKQKKAMKAMKAMKAKSMTKLAKLMRAKKKITTKRAMRKPRWMKIKHDLRFRKGIVKFLFVEYEEA